MGQPTGRANLLKLKAGEVTGGPSAGALTAESEENPKVLLETGVALHLSASPPLEALPQLIKGQNAFSAFLRRPKSAGAVNALAGLALVFLVFVCIRNLLFRKRLRGGIAKRRAGDSDEFGFDFIVESSGGSCSSQSEHGYSSPLHDPWWGSSSGGGTSGTSTWSATSPSSLSSMSPATPSPDTSTVSTSSNHAAALPDSPGARESEGLTASHLLEAEAESCIRSNEAKRKASLKLQYNVQKRFRSTEQNGCQRTSATTTPPMIIDSVMLEMAPSHPVSDTGNVNGTGDVLTAYLTCRESSSPERKSPPTPPAGFRATLGRIGALWGHGVKVGSSGISTATSSPVSTQTENSTSVANPGSTHIRLQGTNPFMYTTLPINHGALQGFVQIRLRNMMVYTPLRLLVNGIPSSVRYSGGQPWAVHGGVALHMGVMAPSIVPIVRSGLGSMNSDIQLKLCYRGMKLTIANPDDPQNGPLPRVTVKVVPLTARDSNLNSGIPLPSPVEEISPLLCAPGWTTSGSIGYSLLQNVEVLVSRISGGSATVQIIVQTSLPIFILVERA